MKRKRKRRVKVHYLCSNLNRIDAQRVRGINDAARIFAHRLAEKYFGRGARCLLIRRVRSLGNDIVQYRVQIGTMSGRRITAPLTVHRNWRK